MKVLSTSTAAAARPDPSATQSRLAPAGSGEHRAPEARGLPKQERAESQPVDDQTAQRLQEQAGRALSRFGHKVGFTRHSDGNMVMQIVDKQSGDVVRQIPGEDALALAAQLEELRGLLFSGQG